MKCHVCDRMVIYKPLPNKTKIEEMSMKFTTSLVVYLQLDCLRKNGNVWVKVKYFVIIRLPFQCSRAVSTVLDSSHFSFFGFFWKCVLYGSISSLIYFHFRFSWSHEDHSGQ